MSDDYDRGFRDGLAWVSDALKRSATIVAQTERGDFDRPNGGTVHAIVRVGQIHFAKQLLEVAKTIDEAIEASR